MRVTQGTFSYLPDLTDEQIAAQVQYCLDHGWAINIEYTDDAHPRNTYWEMWGVPTFDLVSTGPVLDSLRRCRDARPGVYIRISAFDDKKGWESIRLSFIVQRPAGEPGFLAIRTEGSGRRVGYTLQPYATTRPPDRRYP
jgi:ribulose-bisphosphate carboxylase small chain